jgi:hypothetical protein
MGKSTIIMLDKERHISLDLNDMCDFQELTGKNLFNANFWKEIGPKDVVALLWVALVKDEPALTQKDIGKLIDPSHMEKVITALSDAIFD